MMENILDFQVLEIKFNKAKNILKNKINDDKFFTTFVSGLTIKKVNVKDIYIDFNNVYAKNEFGAKWLSLFNQIFNNICGEDYRIVIESLITHGITANIDHNRMFIGSFNSDVIGKSDNILNGKNKILFFQGSIGSGRTTIINHLAVKYKDKKILVIESNEISDKIFILLANDKNKSIESIKNNLFNYEIILFDNLEYFINKPKFCELLFNLFKELNAANKKIIISSSNTVDFKKINQEFYSYITNDLISEINKPSLNELKTISVFFVKSLNNKINFTDEALDFLATRNGNGNLRKLKSDISSILFYTNEGNGTITVNDVKKYIEMPIKGKNNTLIVDPNKIISSICSYFKIDENEVKSPQRNKYIVNIRNICMYGLNKKYHLTLKNIGSHFSNKSHSNVKRSVDLVQNRAEKNDQFAKEIELLFKNL